MTKFDQIYRAAVFKIFHEGIEEKNNRTGVITRSLPGITLQTDIEKDGFPILTLRKLPLKAPIAEQIWFLQGVRETGFLDRYTTIWDEFKEENGTIPASYGYRWRKAFGKDQIASLIELLKKDPTSRHGVVITWDPKDDGHGGTPKKNVPCPYTFTVNIIGGRLHLHNIIRSNDMMLGCPFDVFGFALLQYIFAQELGVKPGIYTHSISNAHIYADHFNAVDELLTRKNDHEPIVLTLPPNTYHKACHADYLIVDQIASTLREQYFPLPNISGLNIII